MAKIIVETSQAGEIPLLTIKDETATDPPLVFFLHGFTATKEESLSFGYELARRGFCTVAFDAVMHGERLDPRLEVVLSGKGANIYPTGTGLDAFFLMHEIIVQTGKDINTLITHFRELGGINTDAVGLTGFSMGGFAAFYTAAKNPKIQAVVPIAGIPAFETRWKDVVLESSTYPGWAAAMENARDETERRTKFMAEIDPFDALTGFFPKHIFIILGDLDTHSNKKYTVDLYRKLKPVYRKHPGRLRLGIYDEIGHQLTTEMIQDACDWFEQALK